MRGGYIGKLLRLNLTTGVITPEPLPPDNILRKYIGGVGLASKILYDEVPLNTKPLDPENRLLFLTGPLGGTPAPTSNECCVCCLSHETGYTMGVGHFHGFFGSTLKFAGFDGIIIEGRAGSPVYVWINDGLVELRDASGLWGKDSHVTVDLIRAEVNQPEAAVACIGPAGEALMKGAAVCTDYHHMSAKGGAGAVMGSKKLKAIAVWGTQGVPVADPDRFIDVMLEWRRRMFSGGTNAEMLLNGGIATRGYETMGNTSITAFKNLSDPDGGTAMAYAISAFAKKSTLRPQGSFCCPVACAYRLEVGEGPHKGFVATPGGGGENIEGASLLMGVTDPGTCYWLTEQFDRMGWDSATPGLAIALLFELYERGLITKQDVDGLELKWGNADVIPTLMEKTIKREGIGKVLAEGPKATAEHFGAQALNAVAHIKGTGPNIHDWRSILETLFSYVVAPAGPCHQGIGTFDPDLGQEYMFPLVGTLFRPDGRALATRKRMLKKLYDDCLGVCWFSTMGVERIGEITAQALEAVTGWQGFTKEEGYEVGERIVNLMQAFSVVRGHTPAHDLDVGGRWLEPPNGGLGKGMTIAPFLKGMIREYYTVMGWDAETGKPHADTLVRLGLSEVADKIAAVNVPVRLSETSLETATMPEKEADEGNVLHN
jgi:aldehyde:ferredoxin oxidoreductase